MWVNSQSWSSIRIVPWLTSCPCMAVDGSCALLAHDFTLECASEIRTWFLTGFLGSLTRLMIRILSSLPLRPAQRRFPTDCSSCFDDILLLYFASMVGSDLDRPSLPFPPTRHRSKNSRHPHHLLHYFHCLHPNRPLHQQGQRRPLAPAATIHHRS